MSINVHSALPPTAAQNSVTSADLDFDAQESWAETIITITVTVVTVLFVSFIAVLMTMA